MLAVERFDFKKKSAPPLDVATTSAESHGTHENNGVLEAILKRSRQRIQQKHQTLKLLQQPQLPPSQRKDLEERQRQSIQNIEKILETDDEKKRRKLSAKNEKKERKIKLREILSAAPVESLVDNDAKENTEHHESEEDNEEEDEEADMEVVKAEDPQPLPTTSDASTTSADLPVSYLPFSLPNKDQKINEALTKAQSPTIPPAIMIKEKVTVNESIAKWGVDPHLADDILSDGIEEFFPVQVAVIPLLLSHALYQPFAPPRDMIVSAPTGSGKTLAYALPIIQSLSLAQRLLSEQTPPQRRRLHALVILPSRELVTQVSLVSSLRLSLPVPSLCHS
jgi:hypothetical protein